MNKTANEIKCRLSLRKPQAESLEILSEIADVLELEKNINLAEAKEKIKEPFVIINSDDFYGRDAYFVMSHYLKNLVKNLTK